MSEADHPPTPLALKARRYHEVMAGIAAAEEALGELRIGRRLAAAELAAAHVAELPPGDYYVSDYDGCRYKTRPHSDGRGIERLRLDPAGAGKAAGG